MDLTLIILVILALAAGGAVGYLLGRGGTSKLEARIESQLEERIKLEERLESETGRANRAENELAERNADYRNLKEKLDRQGEELEEMHIKLQEKFENLANKILEEKSKKFTEQNREKLDQVLKPLGEKLEEFRKKVEESHKEDIKGRSALEQHLKTLHNLNQNMAEEAKNLTRALKGDSKRQGNWGEVILQRILERTGLQKDREYVIQPHFTNDDGKRLQPDVIVHLPDDKHLVIDSKVSLKDYETYISSEDELERQSALKNHLASLRGHLRNLGSKEYQKLYEENSPDFILMFIPIEPAFGLAMQHDPELYNEAFTQNIIIVSPTTLLATLATIDNVWKQEYQNKNVRDIAERGGALYDKFVGFAEDMKKIGERIDQSQQSYQDAMNKLSTGKGNLVRQVEMLRELGAKTSKQLPGNLADPDPDDGETNVENLEENSGKRQQ